MQRTVSQLEREQWRAGMGLLLRNTRSASVPYTASAGQIIQVADRDKGYLVGQTHSAARAVNLRPNCTPAVKANLAFVLALRAAVVRFSEELERKRARLAGRDGFLPAVFRLQSDTCHCTGIHAVTVRQGKC